MIEGNSVTDENELSYEILVDRVDYLVGELQGLAEDVHLYHEIFENAEAVEMLNKTAPRLFLRFQRGRKTRFSQRFLGSQMVRSLEKVRNREKIFRSNAFRRIFESSDWVPIQIGGV